MHKIKNYKDIEQITFGQHMIIDCYGCDKEPADSMDVVHQLLKDLVEVTGLHELMPPYLVKATSNLEDGGKDSGGISGFVMIQESHISVHTFALRGYATLDVYSCKPFDARDVLKVIKKTLKCEDIDVMNMERGLKYPKEDIYTI
jgi:S-adenosylmethionine decarboxylase